MKEKNYKIYYGDKENEYIVCSLKDTDILNGHLSEAKAFDIFFTDMIMCNDYFKYNYDNIDYLINSYDEENDEYIDEYQIFIVNLEYDEDASIKAIKKMGNTLYYDNKLNLYITGITDLGTSRESVGTDIVVKELNESEVDK